MIEIVGQDSMLSLGDIFLHQETEFSETDVSNMDEFEKYYQARELVKNWNTLNLKKLKIKELSLEIMGIDFIIK